MANTKKKKSTSKNKKARRVKTAMNQPTPRHLLHWGRPNKGEFIGEKFVKKAGMTITFTNYNTENRTDSQEWS